MGSIPDIYYEQYVLGELDEAKRALVEAAPDFDLRIAEIRRSNADILAAYPAQAMATRIRNAYEASERSSASPPRRRWFSLGSTDQGGVAATRGPVLSFGLSAAALVVVAVAAFVIGGGSPTVEDGVRTKGLDAQIRVYRAAGVDVEVLDPDGTVAEGDVLQLSYNAAGGRYGTLFSIDGRGTFTLHYPENPELPASVEPSGEVLLPYAYRLDDAPRFEKFYFVTSVDPFDLDDVFDAVSAQLDSQQVNPDYEIRFPDGLSTSSIVLRKTR